MSRRKGELTKAGIDKGWPHQVGHPERLSCREHWRAHHQFIEEHKLSLCTRGHCLVRDGEWWNIKCFATEADARTFMAAFGGEYFTPQTRPKQ